MNNNEWVKVEDKEPPAHVAIIICVNGKSKISQYFKGTWSGNYYHDYLANKIEGGKVTHWMHLPPPPQTT